MNMTDQAKLPIWFWIVGVVALLWNGIGVLAYLQQALMSAEEFAALPELKKRIAVRLFLVSLLAVIVQFSSYFIVDGYMEFASSQGWLMPGLILLFAVGLLLLSRQAEQKGLLR